jgi:hypothetical protein
MDGRPPGNQKRVGVEVGNSSHRALSAPEMILDNFIVERVIGLVDGDEHNAAFLALAKTHWGNVTADNRRCRSLSIVTSTMSATRSTMELLRAELNPASHSYSN